MKLILVGPDDSGYWYLEDANGLSWRLVERWSHLPSAAALFGWVAPDGATEDEQAEAAREFLIENIGEKIQAPLHIAQYFEEMQRETGE